MLDLGVSVLQPVVWKDSNPPWAGSLTAFLSTAQKLKPGTASKKKLRLKKAAQATIT
jgi:hypothetical protein